MKNLEALVPSNRPLQDLALLMTVNCVRNTVIENYHAAGKISDSEMKAINKAVANRLYTVLIALLDPKYKEDTASFFKWLEWNYPHNWDLPEFDAAFGSSILESYARRHGKNGHLSET